MCLILGPTRIAVFWPLDLEDQIIFFTQCDFDILVCVEEDPGELVSARRVLAVLIEVFERAYECRSEVLVGVTLRVLVVVCTSRGVNISGRRKLYFFEIRNFIDKNFKFLSRTSPVLAAVALSVPQKN